MRLIRNLHSVPAAYQNAVVALGNFDGLHKGHQAVIKQAQAIAKTTNAPTAILTFEPHPKEYFKPELAPLRIYNLRTKIALLRDMGVDALFLQRFNAAFAALSPEIFITHVLLEGMKARHVVTGEDFIFGHARKGNAQMLQQAANDYGFGYTPIPTLTDAHGNPCSSTRIRNFLKEGDIQNAAHLLGRPYGMSGRVIHGDKRGRQIGFPTANIHIGERFYPKYGVYAIRARISKEQRYLIPTSDGAIPPPVGGRSGGGRIYNDSITCPHPNPPPMGEGIKSERLYNGVANLGVRPSFGVNSPLLEVHLFDYSQNLYGEQMHVELVQYIRPEQRFEGVEALKAQINRDCKAAKTILQSAT